MLKILYVFKRYFEKVIKNMLKFYKVINSPWDCVELWDPQEDLYDESAKRRKYKLDIEKCKNK